MHNIDIARVLSEIGDLIDVQGGNPFKVRAYRQAALVLETLAEPAESLVSKGILHEVPGIGKGIESKIVELIETGRCAEHERLAAEVPAGVLELLRLEGIGPRTAASAWKQLGIRSVDALEEAAVSGRLELLERMGPQRVKDILESIQRYRRRAGRISLFRALGAAEPLVARLRQLPGVVRAEIAGSVRRRKDTIGDLDLLASAAKAAPVITAFAHLPEVDQVIAEGPTKCSVRLRTGLQADLRVIEPAAFGAALHYFTGSKVHSIALRTRAVRAGIKLNEYGVFDDRGRRIGGEREEDVFRALGLPWIPPELREGTGEIEVAERGELPDLVEEEDIVGDLHVHSEASPDAASTLEEILRAGKRLGRHYIAITDHSRSRPSGLDAAGALTNAAAVREASRRRRGRPHLMTGIEVDIRSDGTLDLPDDVLAQLDWVVASIHSRFHDSRDVMTDRIVRAIESGVVDVIGHPTGRLLGMRDPYELDFDRVLAAAREHGVALEVNAQPERMDLPDALCRRAKESGVGLVISTDAHAPNQLENLRFGVWAARRGWVRAADVLNASDRPWRARIRRGAARLVRSR